MRLVAALLLIAPLVATAQPVNTDSTGLALKGHDPVAYFTMGHAMPGDARFVASHEGATYRFASAEHRDAFVKEPAKFAPQYGGYCAFGVAGGYKVKIDPQAFTVHEGKLFLNYDRSVQKRWLADMRGFLGKSESAWPGLRDKPRRDKPGA